MFPAPPAGTHWDGLGVPVRDGGFNWCFMMVPAALQPVGLGRACPVNRESTSPRSTGPCSELIVAESTTVAAVTHLL